MQEFSCDSCTNESGFVETRDGVTCMYCGSTEVTARECTEREAAQEDVAADIITLIAMNEADQVARLEEMHALVDGR